MSRYAAKFLIYEVNLGRELLAASRIQVALVGLYRSCKAGSDIYRNYSASLILASSVRTAAFLSYQIETSVVDN